MTPSSDERFTEIYEQHYANVLAYCGRRLDRTEAEEVTNEVFLVLWRRIDEFDEKQPLAWPREELREVDTALRRRFGTVRFPPSRSDRTVD